MYKHAQTYARYLIAQTETWRNLQPLLAGLYRTLNIFLIAAAPKQTLPNLQKCALLELDMILEEKHHQVLTQKSIQTSFTLHFVRTGFTVTVDLH